VRGFGACRPRGGAGGGTCGPPSDAGAVSGFSRDLRPTEKRRWTGADSGRRSLNISAAGPGSSVFRNPRYLRRLLLHRPRGCLEWIRSPVKRNNPRLSRREPRQLLAMTTMSKRNDPVADFSTALRPYQVDDPSRAWHHCFPTQSRPRFARRRELQFHEFGSGSGENRSDPDPVGCLASPRMSLMPEHRQSTRDCILDARAPPTGKDARQAIRHRSNRSFSHHQEAV
jgi:hypothetical protein